MKAMIFDLDDTLYDQIQPFKKALDRHLQVADELVGPLYLAFRHHADQVFEAAATGKMSLKDSHIYRMKAALADFGFQISDALALTIQIDYDYFQGQLELSPIFPKIFAHCKEKGLALGIITNGPYRHQLRKIRSLGLEKWIPEDRIIISGQVGMMKPVLDIFKLMEQRLDVEAEEICYLGDSFENDVVGSKRAGWQSIWFNHRKRQAPNNSYRPNFIVEEWDELSQVLQYLLNK